VNSSPVLAPAAGGADPERLRRDTRLLSWLLGIGIAIALACAATRFQANPILAAMAGGLVVAAWHRYLLAWPTLLGLLLVVILFLPIRRYTLGAGFPIDLEPYRLVVALVLIAWMLSLLADPDTRWRKTGLEIPVIGFSVVVLLSLAFNVGRVNELGISGEVLKQASFFLSFVLVMYFVTSVITGRRQLDAMVMLLVAGGTLIALLSIVEWRTGYNAFNHLHIPGLNLDPSSASGPPLRGERPRAYASAQHPIALAAALVLLLPLAVYLYRRYGKPAWLVCAAALTLGALATGSRTAAVMLVVELLVFFWIKRKETVRLLPLLLPLFIACQIVMPGTLGTFKAVLFPEQGLIAEQKGGGDTGSGRVADLGPALEEFSRTPFVGQGFGTRLTSDTDKVTNAKILDNEWLAMLIEVGFLGTLFLVWIYAGCVRRLARASQPDDSAHSWLLAALAAGIAAFAVGMFTYDAFSFIQVTFLCFILLGLAAAAMRLGPPKAAEPATA
jgi:polysaccharide biosynthesis protein PslJ